MIKFFTFSVFFLMIFMPFVCAQSGGKELSLEDLDKLSSYVWERVDAEDVDCSNIVPFVQSYLELSQANQHYLAIAARRLQTTLELSPDPSPAKLKKSTGESPVDSCSDSEDLSNDLACVSQLISDNEALLFDQADIIQTVLPGCLQKN